METNLPPDFHFVHFRQILHYGTCEVLKGLILKNEYSLSHKLKGVGQQYETKGSLKFYNKIPLFKLEDVITRNQNQFAALQLHMYFQGGPFS